MSWQGKHHSEETKRKISESKQGKGGRSGSLNPMYGKRYTEEEKMMISMRTSKALNAPGMHDKLSKSHTGIYHTEETKAKISKANSGLKRSEDAKVNIIASAKKRMAVPENNPMFGKKHTQDAKSKIGANSKKVAARMWAGETFRDNMKQVHKELWANPGYREAAIRRMADALHVTPNKKEIKLRDALESMYPGEWKFVGDRQVMIAGMFPDFVSTNGQKKIIEMFGDYWHRGQNPQDRADIFSPFGYETLVIWEHELKNMESVKSKIQDFHERKAA